MTAQTQPEALRLAAWLNEGAWHNITLGDVNAAGRELRRQHARIAELEAEKANLRDALSDIASGEIMRSHCIGPHCTEELGVATADELSSRAYGALDWDDRVAEPPTQLREKRQPLSDEQIKGVLEIVKTVIACVNEAHHAKSEGWRDGCFASADSAYSRIEPYLREIGTEEQS